jgi:hypothetical protein
MGEPFVRIEKVKDTYPEGPALSWWYSAAEAGKVPSYKLGKYRLFKLSEIEAWVVSQRSGPPVKSNGA